MRAAHHERTAVMTFDNVIHLQDLGKLFSFWGEPFVHIATTELHSPGAERIATARVLDASIATGPCLALLVGARGNDQLLEKKVKPE